MNPELTKKTKEGYANFDFAVERRLLSLAKIHRVRTATWNYYQSQAKGLISQEAKLNGGDSDNFCYSLKEAPEEINLILDCKDFQDKIFSITGWKRYILYDYYLFFKPPGAPSTPWHRDGDSIPLEGDAITAWIPLTPMRYGITYALGTGLIDPAKSKCENIGELTNLFQRIKASNYTPELLRPGDVLVHNRVIWHHGPENTNNNYRLALSLSLVSSDCRININPKGHDLQSAYMMRKASYDNNLSPNAESLTLNKCALNYVYMYDKTKL